MKNQMAQLGILIIYFIGISLFSIRPSWATEVQGLISNPKTIKFEDLKKMVSEKNENVEASKLQTQANDKRRGKLLRSFLPKISAVGGKEQFKSGEDTSKSQEYWKVAASVNLYSGGRDKIEGEIRDSSFELSKKNTQAEYRNELRKAQSAYWNLVAINQVIKDHKDGVLKNEKNLQASRRRSGAGLTTNADAAQFELHRIALQRDLTKLERERDIVQNELGLLLAFESHESIVVDAEFPAIPQSISNVDISSDRLIAVQVNKEIEKIELLKSNQASRWWLPRLDIYSSYGLPSMSEEYDRSLQKRKEWATGIRVTIDLDQGFEDLVESQARRLEASSSKKKVQFAIRDGKAKNHNLNHDMQTIHSIIKVTSEDLKVAENFLKLTESEYNRGVKNGPDLLEAIQKYYEFREKRIIYYRDYFMAKAHQDSLIAGNED